MNTLASIGSILIAVLVLAVVAVVAFFVVRSMKGKIELQLVKTGFNSGEPVSGTVNLTTKKSLEMRRLFVALIGYEVTERRESDGDKRTDRDEIFRDEVNLEEAQTVPAGFSKSYQFAITAPGQDTIGNRGKGGGLLGGLSIGIGSLTLGNNRRLEWKVEARADLPGVDLAKSKSVRVNVS